MKTKVIRLKRAKYGWGKPIPLHEREYTIVDSSSNAVGTIAEILEFLGKKGYERVTLELEDADGITILSDLSCEGFI